MQINPGGILDIADIVGRERESARYWQILERQGLVLSAERRLGKSHIVRKMHARGQQGFVTFYQELEGVHSTVELITETYHSVRTHLPRMNKLKGKAIEIWDGLMPQRIGTLEVPKASENWKPLLTHAIEDVLDVIDPAQKLVLMWDEFPLMLYNIRRQEGAERAIHLLDQLRHLRQVHGQRLRFLFTGSIGLNLARHKIPAATDEQLRAACQLLRQDHYLTLERGEEGALYGFRWPFIKRWWKENRL